MSEQENNELTKLLSPQRLSSYENLDEHFKNLALVSKITPKLALIEIALRNLMDNLLKQNNKQWLLNSNDDIVCKMKKEILERANTPNATLSHEQFLSRFTLGANIAIIKKYKLQDRIFNFKKLNFRDFYDGNKNYYLSKSGNKIKFKKRYKVSIMLNLFRGIRNRAFHWDNLYKLTQKGQKLVPRLSTNAQNTILSIHPQKIELFLDYILNSLNGVLLKALNEKMGE